jgi:hypothetical protein
MTETTHSWCVVCGTVFFGPESGGGPDGGRPVLCVKHKGHEDGEAVLLVVRRLHRAEERRDANAVTDELSPVFGGGDDPGRTGSGGTAEAVGAERTRTGEADRRVAAVPVQAGGGDEPTSAGGDAAPAGRLRLYNALGLGEFAKHATTKEREEAEIALDNARELYLATLIFARGVDRLPVEPRRSVDQIEVLRREKLAYEVRRFNDDVARLSQECGREKHTAACEHTAKLWHRAGVFAGVVDRVL